MPLEIPKSAKVYTTAYSDFKGVDYTNDATNVWKKRSPTGLNMSPDLDGKPYKRKGWKVEKSVLNILYPEFDLDAALQKMDFPGGVSRTYSNGLFTIKGQRSLPVTSVIPLYSFRRNTFPSIRKWRVKLESQKGDDTFALITNKRSVMDNPFRFNSDVEFVLDEDETPSQIAYLVDTHLPIDTTFRISLEPIVDFAINKLYYFELNGYEHIMAFTSNGLFAYREDPNHYSDSDDFVCISTDEDCIESYERAFFFEGNGTSAFYVYGNGKVWAYEYDAERIATDPETGINNKGFIFSEKAPYVPRVRIGVSANGDIGEPYESVNLFGRFIAEEFQNNLYEQSLNITYSENIMTASVTSEFYKKLPSNGTYRFTYDGTDWKLNGSGINLVDYGITYAGNEVSGDYIEVVSQSNFKCRIALEVAETQNPIVKVSTSAQFDTELEVIKNGTPTDSQVRMDTSDGVTTFTFSRAYLPVVSGEDGIRIEYPRFTNIHTQHTTEDATVTVNAEVI